MKPTTTKGFRRQYSLISDFAAAHVDESLRPAAQEACDRLNAAAINDNWTDAKAATLYGATAISRTDFGVVLRCTPVARL